MMISTFSTDVALVNIATRPQLVVSRAVLYGHILVLLAYLVLQYMFVKESFLYTHAPPTTWVEQQSVLNKCSDRARNMTMFKINMYWYVIYSYSPWIQGQRI